MQFHFFTALVLLLSTFNDAQAAPATKAKRGPGMVTMPLRSVRSLRRNDVHPHIYIQQHINRSNRRLARMTGREAPSDLEMRESLQKRVDHVHIGYAAGDHTHSKRYVVKTPTNKKTILAETDTSLSSGLGNNFGQVRGTSRDAKKKEGEGNLGFGSSSQQQANSTFTNGNSNSTSDSSASNSTATGSGSNSAGVDPLDIAAAQKGGLTTAQPPSSKNSVALDIDANDASYVGTVQIGTPPTDFHILMDSGSADFWVGGENCQSSAGGDCGSQAHTFLGSKLSSTFKDSGSPFNVTYGSGAVAGTLIQDNVVLAGLNLPGHAFGVATEETPDFADDSIPFDGLMGLAQSTLSNQQVLTPPESLAKAGAITDAITSFKISRLADKKNDGEVTFGGVDTTKFDAQQAVTFDNVNKQGFWEGAFVGTVNGQSVGIDQGRTAILDTGTTLMLGPADDVAAVHKAINGSKPDGQGGFLVPCTMTDVVSLAFGNPSQQFDIDPRDVAFLPVDNNDPAGDCQSGIQAGQIGGATEWLVGDVFLKNAYFSVDVGKNAITLAKLV